jgi:hypothetical protein
MFSSITYEPLQEKTPGRGTRLERRIALGGWRRRALSAALPKDSDRHYVETGHPFEVPRVRGRDVYVDPAGSITASSCVGAPDFSFSTVIDPHRRGSIRIDSKRCLKQRNAPGENRTATFGLKAEGWPHQEQDCGGDATKMRPGSWRSRLSALLPLGRSLLAAFLGLVTLRVKILARQQFLV